VIPTDLRWRIWAKDNKDGKALTGSELLDFVNLKLFPTLKKIQINQDSPMKHKIVKAVFSDANQYMKDGINLRQVINVIDDINFNKYEEKHAFGDIYESILRNLQSAGNAGEFYTPRAVTDFMVEMIDPKLGESIADFACGTGGFLTSTLKKLEEKVKTTHDREKYVDSVYGIEKKPLPYLLAITNLLIHDIDEPNVIHGNSLDRDVREYREKDKFDVILMNPPYGGSENDSIINNFPADLKSSETADLFMSVIMYRLKKEGRAAVILPDGFLFGTDNSAKVNIKKRLLSNFNLHTIVRLPGSVFAPYTSITTNILFFESGISTKSIWYYRMDMPDGYKNFSKTKPIQLSHFDPIKEWWDNRKEIKDIETDTYKSKEYTLNEIENRNLDLDLCSFPTINEEVLSPEETILIFNKKQNELNSKIQKAVSEIQELIGKK
jgi:type I restriction enzyme M protein